MRSSTVSVDGGGTWLICRGEEREHYLQGGAVCDMYSYNEGSLVVAMDVVPPSAPVHSLSAEEGPGGRTDDMFNNPVSHVCVLRR